MSGMEMFFFSSTFVVCLNTASATSCSDTLRAEAYVREMHALRLRLAQGLGQGLGAKRRPWLRQPEVKRLCPLQTLGRRCVPAKDALVLPNLHLDGELADSGERSGQRLRLVKHLEPDKASAPSDPGNAVSGTAHLARSGLLSLALRLDCRQDGLIGQLGQALGQQIVPKQATRQRAVLHKVGESVQTQAAASTGVRGT